MGRNATMPEENKQYAVIFDAVNGLQLLDTETNEVADLAVLEAWRPKGEPMPEVGGPASEEEVRGQALQLGNLQATATATPAGGMALRQYGDLRVRSTGAMIFNISGPAMRTPGKR
jgi:hypothetical protein